MDRPQAPGPAGPRLTALRALFFLSGFPALLYQLVWQRALLRIFGSNVESVTIVVAAFMIGLGAGSLAGGWLSRARLPMLLVLAALEALTAAFGLASLPLFEAVGEALLGAPLAATAAATLALVAMPTVLMGASLPVLVAHLVRRTADVGGAVGTLYHANTLGAATACLAGAAALFPLLGMTGAVRVAVLVNLLVAAGAVLAHVRARAPSSRSPRTAGAPTTPPGAREDFTLARPAVLALAAAGGFVSLSFEIFAFRIVSYATGSSAPAFALTLAAFLAGLAEGSRRAGVRCREGARPALAGAARAVLLGALGAAAFLPVLGRAAALGWAVIAVALALVAAVAGALGVLLPTLAHLGVRGDGEAGMGTALVVLANIAGSAAGSVATGFVLMDRLGAAGLGALVGAAGLAVAALLGAAAPEPSPGVRLRRAAVPLALAAAAAVAVPALSRRALERLLWKRDAPAHGPFAEVVENRSGIVAVDRTGTVFGHGLYDGRFNTGLREDTNGIVRAYALGLYHPAPRDVLLVGLSSGSWAQVIAHAPGVATVTVVEINPGYAGLVAGRPEVASLLSNPKVRIDVDDGRRWLRAHPERRFDAIVANTTYHFRANATSLLSAEFLALVRRHLAPGGTYQFNTTGSARALRTGCLAFPHGVRLGNQLVLSDAPIRPDPARWRRRLEAWRIDGRPVLDPAREADRRVLDGLAPPAVDVAAGRADGWLEPCASVLARTAGRAPITDDNMGTEWRRVFGVE